MTTPQEHPNSRDVREVRTVGPATPYAPGADSIVNDLLKLGWVLLHASITESGRPVFVLGWSKDGEAPKSKYDEFPEGFKAGQAY